MSFKLKASALLVTGILLSACGARNPDPSRRFEGPAPVIGLATEEPTPAEVDLARERGEEHPLLSFGPRAEPAPWISLNPDVSPIAANRKDALSAARVKRVKKPTFSLAPSEPAALTAAGDTDSGLEFCHSAKWSNACLTGLMVYRCGQYAFPFTPAGCAASSISLVGMLELERIDITFEDDDGTQSTYNLPVIFTKKLQTLIETPSVQSDLHALRLLLESSAKDRTPVNLWNWTLGRTNGNVEKALEWISVLLQDTSAIQINVEYLRLLDREGKLSRKSIKSIEDLSQISTFLTVDHLAEVKWREFLALYPATKNIENDTTPLVYHFYPMAYLGNRLRKIYGNRLGSFLPFLFNTEYLNQTLDPEMWPLRHPRSEKIDLSLPYIQWKMQDMYGGLSGALFGVGKISETPGLKSFQEAYAKNPFGTMQRLFWTLP